MHSLFAEHRGFWNQQRKRSLYLGILLIILSLAIQISAGRYSSRSAASADFADDLFLDNLPEVNMDFVIVQGALIFWIAAWILLIFKPRYLLFGLKAIALFVVLRAFFINLTPLGIYPRQVDFYAGGAGSRLYNLFTFRGNFFFSGHTGFPFLLSLIFWDKKFWRYLFLLAAVFLAASVLLAHVHYSIDVFAAPFITYGIFIITSKLFSHDYELLAYEPQNLTRQSSH